MGRFQKHIFICNNQRKEDDPRGCCTARGSLELMDYLKQRVHDSGLKGKVRVNKAGCLDACAYGPTMVVYPDDVWYGRIMMEDVEEIVERHFLGNQPVERLTLGPDDFE